MQLFEKATPVLSSASEFVGQLPPLLLPELLPPPEPLPLLEPPLPELLPLPEPLPLELPPPLPLPPPDEPDPPLDPPELEASEPPSAELDPAEPPWPHAKAVARTSAEVASSFHAGEAIERIEAASPARRSQTASRASP